jgi:hypothetical protein
LKCRAAGVLAGLLAALVSSHVLAASPRYCDAPKSLSAAQHDSLLRFGAVIKAELEKTGHHVALLARSGLELSLFDQRYSHAGVGLKAGTEGTWAVRQLYYACEEGQPRLFDQGLPAFVLGGDEPELGYVSVLLLPPEPAAQLAATARDRRQALQLLSHSYSANAYPFSTLHQNCNQWLAELLAFAWGGLHADEPESARTQAQRWLQTRGYEPTVFDVGWRMLMWVSELIPWIHTEDHPAEDLAQQRYRVSMPASINNFVRAAVPGTERLEFCHTPQHVVVRRGWLPIADGCQPGPDDTVVKLQ